MSNIAYLAALLGAGTLETAPVGAQQPGWMPIEAQVSTPRLHGTWHSAATGHLISFTQSNTLVFHEVGSLCLPDTGQLPDIALIRLSSNADQLAVHFYDYRAHPALLQNPLVLERIDALPETCRAQSGSNELAPIALFDALWSVFDDHYAFFSERNVNWDQARETFRPAAEQTTSAEALFPVLTEMLAPLRDGHVNLSGAGQTFNAGRPHLRERLADVWQASSSDLDEGAFVSEWSNAVRRSIEAILIDGSYQSGADGALEWGLLRSDVGYLRINRFSRFDTEAPDRPAELATLRRALERVDADLGAVDRLILDVVHNGGGHDAAAMTVVEHFLDQDRTVLTYEVDGIPARSVVLSPSQKGSASPSSRPEILLVTSEITASAAEAFVLMMRALPHVTHVGETTRGGISSLLPKPLPLGFQVTVSYQRVLDLEGALYEGRGITPERQLALFPPGNIYGGYSQAISELANEPRGH